MSAPTLEGRRALTRITAKRHLGAGAQVDDHASIIAPTDPGLTDPFLVLMEDWFSTPGFDWHPHRGLETVTTVLDGVLEHGDTLGNAGVLEAGDTQWMTAGRGIIHRELAFRDEHGPHPAAVAEPAPAGAADADALPEPAGGAAPPHQPARSGGRRRRRDRRRGHRSHRAGVADPGGGAQPRSRGLVRLPPAR